jgi:hypothetical protein
MSFGELLNELISALDDDMAVRIANLSGITDRNSISSIKKKPQNLIDKLTMRRLLNEEQGGDPLVKDLEGNPNCNYFVDIIKRYHASRYLKKGTIVPTQKVSRTCDDDVFILCQRLSRRSSWLRCSKKKRCNVTAY